MFKDFHDKYKCIFIHVPKVAGSSIERVIYQTDRWLVGHVKASDYVKFDKNKFESYFSFGFVRNPYDRMVSAYHYLRSGGGNKKDEKWAQDYLYKYKSFEDFIIDLKNDSICNQILSQMHFIPQYKFLCDINKNILVTYIGKFENLDIDFQEVLRLLKRSCTLQHVNKSNRVDYKMYYNRITYDIVRNIFKDDFQIFDYDLEDRKIFTIKKNTIEQIENKILLKNLQIKDLRLEQTFLKQTILTQTFQINSLNSTLKDNEAKLIQIQNSNNVLNKTIKEKDNIINSKTNHINQLQSNIQENLTQLNQAQSKLSFQTKYGTAKTRIQNQLSYKLGQAMILNSKSILGYLIMPMALLSIIISHKQEQKIYQEKIKKDPSLKLPPLESYPDYKEALKLKNHLSYKLGEALIQANKTWYKGGYVKILFEIRKLKREC
ncbi:MULTISPECIES: sulfotransferase family 2 domain-containing protein [Campylobacter]|uniref:sulfotransferase family 2 domain-containing protein n=1 Tax=Campylobacter TaxID=194 RepID=UPI0012847EF0|nr:sulfotransferase family 2 domain-containing protein [Campylobacter sp. RKI_CA19_01122]EAK1250387.1 alpha-2,3-sialyltransferase [Campylobacter lari]MCV3356952.1 sulfotransferase family 2 domain-containing protein [Campylobacter sp. RKI_CA19_01122]